MWNGDRTVKYNERQTLLKKKKRTNETSGKITKARMAFIFIFKSSTVWFLQGEAKEVAKICYVKKQYFSFFHQ